MHILVKNVDRGTCVDDNFLIRKFRKLREFYDVKFCNIFLDWRKVHIW